MSIQIDFSNLKIQITESEQSVVYLFNGDVDENFRHQEVPRIEKPSIIFELSSIRNFNSCGIREWIYFVRDMGKLGNLIFKECSVTVIDQVNMVPDSLGGGAIESFFAPYYCETHGEVNRLISVAEHLTNLTKSISPQFNCDCGKALEFDALEESYFLFTKNLSKVG